MPGALDGIRIIDVTSVLLGPYATQMLGDMGADVIKVEGPPTGDIARNMGTVRSVNMGGIFLNANRNKRSLALDLKQDAAKEVLRRLIPTGDVFVHNMRPQAIAALGFDYDAVAALKQDVIYVGAYGFGQDGPYRAKPAYDDAIQAASGLSSLFVRQDGQARYVPSAMADKVVGLTLSQAIAVALLHKERTGEGQFVEVLFCLQHIHGGVIDRQERGQVVEIVGCNNLFRRFVLQFYIVTLCQLKYMPRFKRAFQVNMEFGFRHLGDKFIHLSSPPTQAEMVSLYSEISFDTLPG